VTARIQRPLGSRVVAMLLTELIRRCRLWLDG